MKLDSPSWAKVVPKKGAKGEALGGVQGRSPRTGPRAALALLPRASASALRSLPRLGGMIDLTRKFDVLVIGGGNAGLCAAISARRLGASVLVVEAAPKFYRGGNTRHTRNMRCAHDTATATLTGPYPEDEFWTDLLAVTGGHTDEALARFMIRQSKEMLEWLARQGIRFQSSLGGTL